MKVKNWNKVYKYAAVFMLFMLTVINCFGQVNPGDPPCDDLEGGVDSCPVPLDTWVMLLAIAAFIFGVYHLSKKQKAVSAS
jgi:hypothetical protein